MTTTLSEIMSRDPLDLTTADIESVIATYRSMASRFSSGDLKAGTTKAATPAALKGLGDTSALEASLNIKL